MDLSQAETLALRLMRKHGVWPEWSFRFDRSKQRHGQSRIATVRGREVKEITLSKYLTEKGSLASVKDTILHEIAHAIVGLEHMHDGVWHAKALELGSNGKVFNDVDYEHIISLAKYRYHCSECGLLTTYSDRLKKNPSRCLEHPYSETIPVSA